jgi:ABC-type transport system involved in multi-copper enzyme maturation permease subunit
MPNEGTGSLPRILAIARNAFREAVRDRVLYNLIIFVLLITIGAIFLGELTAGQEARVIVNLGLSAILIFGTFISIFVGVSLVWKEIEKRTVYSIFSKPVGRGEFIIGKYLGLCVTLLFNLALMAVGVTLALIYVGGGQLIGPMWAAVLLIFFELTIVTAVAILLSSFSSPALSALLTLLVFLIGNFSSSLRDLAEGLGSRAAIIFFNGVYYLLPNLSHFSFITGTSNGEVAPLAMIGFAALYAIVFDMILITITIAIFSRLISNDEIEHFQEHHSTRRDRGRRHCGRSRTQRTDRASSSRDARGLRGQRPVDARLRR